MRKRINVKALAVIVVVLTVVAAGVHYLHGFQVRNNAGILLAQADRAEGEGRLDVAANYLARYLTLVPGETDVRARHALLVANRKLANSPKALLRAFFTLSQVVQIAPSREDVRRRLVQIAMDPAVERLNDAAAHLDKLAPDGELLGTRARCADQLGKFKEARAYYEKAIVHVPGDLSNYIGLAYLLRNKRGVDSAKRRDEDTDALADATIDAMVAANSKSPEAYLLRARYLQEKEGDVPADRKRMLVAVERDVEAARKLNPAAVEVILAVADLAREKNQPQMARALLQQGVARHPGEWRLVQALCRLEMLDGHSQAARVCLRDGLKATPNQPDLLWNYALLLIHQQEHSEANSIIERLAETGLRQTELDYLKARMDFNRGEWRDAARTLERVYPLFLSGYDQRKNWFSFNLAMESSFLLGRCLEHLGDPYRAATIYSRLVDRDPRSVAGRRGLARMTWALGQLDIAEQHYRQLISQGDDSPTDWVELAQLLISRNRQKNPPNWDQVADVLASAEKQPGKSRPAPATLALLRAEVLVARKDYEQARRALENGQDDKQARPVEVWVGLADLEMQRGKADEAVAILEEAAKHLGDGFELQSARARMWARRGGPQAAKALLQLANIAEQLNAADRLRLVRVLADAYNQIGDYREATRLLRQVAEQRPSDLGSRLTLFDLALQTEDFPAMQQLTKEIQRIEGQEEGSLWRYCLAREKIWQAEHGEKEGLTTAVELLRVVADRRPGWARVPLALGQIGELQGKLDVAVASYQRAVLLGEERPAVIRQLVRFLTERGHHLAAEEMIRKLRGQSPSLLTGLERPTAEVALFKGDIAQALALARLAVPADAKDYRDHIWLGRLLWAAGMPAEAEASLRRALALADQVPEPWVALVQHLVRTNDKQRAEAVARQAEQKMSKGQALLDLAQCYDMCGKLDRACELYEAALAKRPEDIEALREMALLCLRTDRLEAAKAFLNRIKEQKTSSLTAIAWANRVLALLTAAKGGNQNTQTALALLGLNGDELPRTSVVADNRDDQRAKVVILANQPSVRKRRQAINILEEFRSTQFISPDDHFLLAQLYESVGEWRKTRSLMTELLNTCEKKLENASKDLEKNAWHRSYGNFLYYYTLKLIRRDELAEAQLWQTKLERLESDTARSLEIKARLLGKRGQGAVAVPSLKKLADNNSSLVLPVAAVLEQIGQVASAEEIFEKYVAESKEPDGVLALAAFLGRRNRPSEGLDLCDRAWTTCPPEAVASASVAILHTAKRTEAMNERVASRLEQAVIQYPQKAALLVHLATVRRLQARHEDALKLLQQVSARDPSDSLVLNNIAWLLAVGGKAEEALTAVDSAIALRGEQANLLDTRAVAYIGRGRYADAVRDLEEAIAEMPTAHRYFHLAQAHQAAKNQSAARDAMQRGINLGLTEATVDPLEVLVFRQLVQIVGR